MLGVQIHVRVQAEKIMYLQLTREGSLGEEVPGGAIIPCGGPPVRTVLHTWPSLAISGSLESPQSMV